jgi:putative transposase
VKFAFIDAEKASFPISRMCRVLGVSQSGFFAWQERPACRRQQQDMVYLAHIRTAFALSNGTYGSPRMRPSTSSTRAMRSGGIARHA